MEGAKYPRLVEAHVGLNALQRILGDKECNLHRAVVSPETHRAPRLVERAALVGKTQRHRYPSKLSISAESARLQPPHPQRSLSLSVHPRPRFSPFPKSIGAPR